ncbi:glycosyltransferase family 4 protein [Methanosarcina sp.]|uniref:glycosyltransferase family 4 protein n=1 Tax=Methanosarcina sp. TaxID=2213 RepID=UPI003C7161B5
MSQKNTSKCILSVCDISPNKRGSFEEFLISLTEKLRENEINHVILFRDKPIKSIEEILLKKGAEIDIFKPSKFSIFNFFSLHKIIKEIRPEIAHFHFYPVYSIVNYLAFFLRIKLIYTDHMGHKKANAFSKKAIRRIYYYTNSKLFNYGISSIICVSNFVKDKYRKEYGIHSEKLSVIYNGINTERFQKVPDIEKVKEKYNIKDEFVVSCVSLRREKGVQCLINAAPAVIRNAPKTKFVLVGEDGSRSSLEEHIKELNLENNFIFTGNTDRIEEIYSISSCVVIPTLADEAFCFVAAEAMSTETTVIAFDSGALKEILYDKSNVISESSQALSEKIVECLENSDSSTKAAREHVTRNFSIDKSTHSYTDLYKDLLK